MIRVLICDDQEIVCEGLQRILDSDGEINVVGTVHNGLEALEMVERLQPDLVLMDLKMSVMNGVVATRKIRERHPEIRILVLTTYDDDEWLFDAIRSGAAGYLLKDRPREELINAIKGTMAGKTYIDPSVAGKVLSNVAQNMPRQQPPVEISLSEREQEVLQLMTQGLSNADIAGRLFLSEGTVRNYTSAIFSKLNVSDRTQAVILALRYGLVDLNR
ncbi:MAG TPA: response regulator transcription factor [Anaerolineaceae bacterium]|nr:response regulator transcription factor [Anaerolineaceae bacterium]HQH85583.1 response regulator transcription factor [Anaerolineaceae bacterium]